MEPGQNNGADRRERRCLSLQTAFTRHSPTFSSLSYSVLPLSITALHLLGSGCYKTHAERNQMTAALKTFHTNQELCFTPLPSFLTPLSLSHTQPTTTANCWYARLAKEFRIIIRRFTRALRRKRALYGAGEEEEVEGRGRTHTVS